MALYQVSYIANEPVYGEVRIIADDPHDAAEIAKKEIEQMYPEYDTVEVEAIEEVLIRG